MPRDKETSLDNLIATTGNVRRKRKCGVCDLPGTLNVEGVDLTAAQLIDQLLARRDAGEPVSAYTALRILAQHYGFAKTEKCLIDHCRFCLGRKAWATP